MSYNLKFNYNGVLRRTALKSLSFEVVESTARTLYSIPSNLKILLTWVDEEKDTITVSSEPEFAEFVRSESAAMAYGVKTLKLGIATEPLLSTNEPVTADEKNQAVHEFVSCDECGTTPIRGARFKCTKRENFDLCASCESKSIQPFPMVKLYACDPAAGLKFFRARPVGCPRNLWRGPKCTQESATPLSGAIPQGTSPEGSNVHEHVTCDECGKRPIVGVRFKCTVRDNFDLCSDCEAKTPQPYPMLKLYTADVNVKIKGWQHHGWAGFGNGRRPRHCNMFPETSGRQRCGRPSNIPEAESSWPRHAPSAMGDVFAACADAAKTFVDDVEEQIVAEVCEMSVNDSISKANEESSSSGSFSKAAETIAKATSKVIENSFSSAGSSSLRASKPMARFVRDVTIPDATVIAPSTEFIKIWLVRNDGPCDWPEDVKLVAAGGDPMCEIGQFTSVESVKVGGEGHIAVGLKTPPSPGRYVSYFRLQAGDGQVFGQKLWVDVRVQPMDYFTSPLFNNSNASSLKVPTVVAVPTSSPVASDQSSEPIIVRFLESKPELADAKVEKTPVSDDDSKPSSIDSSEIINDYDFVIPETEDASPTSDLRAASSTNSAASGDGLSDEDRAWFLEKDELERDWKVELDALRSMGFHDSRECITLLKKHARCSYNRFPDLRGKPFSDALSTIVDQLL